MNAHTCSPRILATIAGYRRLCAELEAENQALRFQNQQLRSGANERVASIFDPLDVGELIVLSPTWSNVAATSADLALITH